MPWGIQGKPSAQPSRTCQTEKAGQRAWVCSSLRGQQGSSGGDSREAQVETAGEDVPGGASFPMLFPPPRPRSPGRGGTDLPSRLQNPTRNPAEMGQKQMGASAFPMTWPMLLRKPGS